MCSWTGACISFSEINSFRIDDQKAIPIRFPFERGKVNHFSSFNSIKQGVIRIIP